MPARWQKQFSFEAQAYSLRPLQSANGNARSVVGNPHTVSTKLAARIAYEEQYPGWSYERTVVTDDLETFCRKNNHRQP